MTREEIAGASRTDGGMFCVMPSVLMYDQNLSWSAKMLYGVITWKCNDKAYCWHTNRALGEVMGLSAKRISTLLSDLEKQGHIEMEVFRDKETGQVLSRHIYPIIKSSRGILTPIPENEYTPPHTYEDTSAQNQGDPLPENAEEKNKKYKTKKENNPKAPKGGGRMKSEPKWKPDRFEAFWAYYCEHGRGEARQKAVKAWDKLQPDDALIDEMARALARQVSSEDWRRGIGIPYASSWLNGRRWEDMPQQKRMPDADAAPTRVLPPTGVAEW